MTREDLPQWFAEHCTLNLSYNISTKNSWFCFSPLQTLQVRRTRDNTARPLHLQTELGPEREGSRGQSWGQNFNPGFMGHQPGPTRVLSVALLTHCLTRRLSYNLNSFALFSLCNESFQSETSPCSSHPPLPPPPPPPPPFLLLSLYM